MDINEPAIVSPSLEVEDQESLQDAYFAWKLDVTGSVSEINLDETLAFSTTGPVISVGLQTLGVEVRPGATSAKPTGSTSLTGGYRIDQIKINERYERSGASEFTMNGTNYDPSSNSWNLLIQVGPMGAFFDRKVIKDIDKNDVGSIVYQTDQNRNWIVHVGYTGYTSFYNCYERDWINSNKDLGAITINGQTSTMQGHRKYYDEWYAFDPSSVHNFALDYNSLNAGNTVTTHSNSKGQMTVKHTP